MILITDRRLMSADAVGAARRALSGAPRGLAALMLREKDMDDRALFELAQGLADVCAETGAPLIVNDRVDVALAISAPGVHLPESGLSPKDARALVGEGRWVGRSVHGPEGAASAVEGGADYVTVGPVFDTPSKRIYGSPIGLEALAEAARHLPVFALGGIGPGEAAECQRAGAHGVAAIRSVWSSADPAESVKRLVEPWTR